MREVLNKFAADPLQSKGISLARAKENLTRHNTGCQNESQILQCHVKSYLYDTLALKQGRDFIPLNYDRKNIAAAITSSRIYLS